MWRATVLTLFPEMFPGPLGASLTGAALTAGLWSLETVDIRDFASDKHRSVDDTPYGGGAGMVLRPDVVDDALRAATGWDGSAGRDPRPLVYLTPCGTPLRQDMARGLADGPGAIVLCGRYEGVDQRVIDAWSARGMMMVSLGDFVLSGGEIAALALLDAAVRLVPGVIGNLESAEEESFEAGLLEYPHFTRPRDWDDGEVTRSVPEVLISGHHERIRDWRQAEAERLTRERRPDLWARYPEHKNDGAGAGKKTKAEGNEARNEKDQADERDSAA